MGLEGDHVAGIKDHPLEFAGIFQRQILLRPERGKECERKQQERDGMQGKFHKLRVCVPGVNDRPVFPSENEKNLAHYVN
jgi:hypothetical protein